MNIFKILFLCGCAFVCGGEFFGRQADQELYNQGYIDGYQRASSEVNLILNPKANNLLPVGYFE